MVAVNDAYRLLPWADVLYACDAAWWETHKGCPDFNGEKWSSHGLPGRIRHNDKSHVAAKYGLNLIGGMDREGFSLDPSIIHYGSNSGFQAVNLAMLWGAERIVLVGFDMHAGGGRHFFGNHPAPLRNAASFANWINRFCVAAKGLPDHIEILNATPGSALNCFPKVNLNDALADLAALAA